MTLSVIDCFAGAGGFSLGLTRAGFEVRAAFDSWKCAVETYNHNLGPHAICTTAESLHGDDLLKLGKLERKGCDLVVGGPPCQGFSIQRRGGDKDVRNDLVLHFLRLVTDISPTMFVMENVAAIQGIRGRHYLEHCVRIAQKAGYKLHTQVLNAADFGVPQIRKRFFLVGEPDDGGEFFSFPKPTHFRDTFSTVRMAIGDLPSPQAALKKDLVIPNHEIDRISDLNRKRISFVPPGGGRADIPKWLQLPCHAVSVDIAGHRAVYGRLDWNKPASTITTKCNSFTRGRFAHPQENRNISMREAARLQSFPDDFVFLGSKVDVAHQIGNAVPPLLAEKLGEAIMAALYARQCGKSIAAKRGQLTLQIESEFAGSRC